MATARTPTAAAEPRASLTPIELQKCIAGGAYKDWDALLNDLAVSTHEAWTLTPLGMDTGTAGMSVQDPHCVLKIAELTAVPGDEAIVTWAGRSEDILGETASCSIVLSSDSGIWVPIAIIPGESGYIGGASSPQVVEAGVHRLLLFRSGVIGSGIAALRTSVVVWDGDRIAAIEGPGDAEVINGDPIRVRFPEDARSGLAFDAELDADNWQFIQRNPESK